MEHYDLLVIGGGAAGMAAAITAAENGLEKILIAEREEYLGGILPQCIHNGVGLGYFKEDLTGPQYAERFVKKINDSSVEIWTRAAVLSVSMDKTAVISSVEKGLCRVSFNELVLATGCRETPIGALPVYGTRPAGIFTAGQAQRMVNLQHLIPGQNIVILGSGDIGLIMARRFTLIGCKVLAVIEQRDTCGGMLRNQLALEGSVYRLLCNTTIRQVHGLGNLEGCTLSDGTYLPCKTLLIAAGLRPERELIAGLENADWITLCGNCNAVHPMVEGVVKEGKKAGVLACEKIRGSL